MLRGLASEPPWAAPGLKAAAQSPPRRFNCAQMDERGRDGCHDLFTDRFGLRDVCDSWLVL